MANDMNGRIIFCNSHFFEVFLKTILISQSYRCNMMALALLDLMDEARDNEKSRHFIKRVKPLSIFRKNG